MITPAQRAGLAAIDLRLAAEVMGWPYDRLVEAVNAGRIRGYRVPGLTRGWRVFLPELLEDCRGATTNRADGDDPVEAGADGRAGPEVVYSPVRQEPELMYGLFGNRIAATLDEVKDYLDDLAIDSDPVLPEVT